MWNKILQDLRKSKEKNDRQRSLAEQIATLNERMGKETGSKFALCFIYSLIFMCLEAIVAYVGIFFALALVVQKFVFGWGCLDEFMC